MAALSTEVKAFIVQSLACYESTSKIIVLVKEEFNLVVTRQQVSAYDPSNAMAKSLSKKWVDLFHATRERFQNEISDIPIANKAYRLRVLNRMSAQAEGMKNLGMTAQLLEQAAKEVGDAYSNKQRVELTGKDGGPVNQVNYTPEDYAKAQAALENQLPDLD